MEPPLPMLPWTMPPRMARLPLGVLTVTPPGFFEILPPI